MHVYLLPQSIGPRNQGGGGGGGRGGGGGGGGREGGGVDRSIRPGWNDTFRASRLADPRRQLTIRGREGRYQER